MHAQVLFACMQACLLAARVWAALGSTVGLAASSVDMRLARHAIVNPSFAQRPFCRRGVTLICGGGFHGKTTLLKAIEAGVYNKARQAGVMGGSRQPASERTRLRIGMAASLNAVPSLAACTT